MLSSVPWWDVVLRLTLAVALGGIIGLDRERAKKPAGIRTHLLVCLGSAVVMLVSIDMFMQFSGPGRNIDPGRIAAQVITGIGFLGAGTIIHAEGLVQGLTTAASIWVVAGIGLACGAGMYFLAVLSVALIILSLAIVNRLIVPHVGKRK